MNLFELITKNYAQALTIKNYDRQEVIFSENELCTQVGFVMKGKLQIATYCTKDDPYIMSVLNSGDTFGETLLFSNEATYYGTILALEKTKVGLISKNILLDLLQHDQTLLHAYLNQMANKSILVNNRLKVLLQKSIREKILFYLHEQLKAHGSKSIPIVSKESLAVFLNIPRPSLSRELSQMAKDGIIIYTKKQITLL